MASSAKKIAWAAVALELVIGAGCHLSEDDRYPPPQPATTTGSGAGTTASTGGQGGAGGEGGGTGGAGGAVDPPNVCECVLSSITKPSCQDCLNASLNTECKTEQGACGLDAACQDYTLCVAKDCDDLPAADKPACVQACVLGPKGEPSYHLYVALVDCLCGVCAAECTASEALTCE